MTDALARPALWLSALANILGRFLLAPIGVLPGWLSATTVSAVTGVFLLVVFKYTSNQRAIKRVRDDINAHLLALKLFKDSAWVSLKAQGRILRGACRLFVLALGPMLVMALPVVLLLAQLALWYQARPFKIGEDTIIVLDLHPNSPNGSSWPAVNLRPTDSVEVIAGPVHIQSKREVCWSVRPLKAGEHQLKIEVDNQIYSKEIAVGDGFMRVSRLRPGWDWSSILLNPWEAPFRPGDPVRSIEIDYPERSGWICGTGHWVIYWFVVSMIAAFCCRRALNVAV
jgi:hypothetical protein